MIACSGKPQEIADLRDKVFKYVAIIITLSNMLVVYIWYTVYSMDSQLADLEIKYKIIRWTEANPEYVSAKTEDAFASQKLIYESLRVAIVKRQFLLKLKAKYAGMIM